MAGETFTYLRPVFYLITIILFCNFAYLIFLKDKIKASNYIIVNSLLLVIVAAI
ncbi:hypothetical protein J2S17_003582 [Cytobacillus purgationiresistens]|uniref:Uncharacterized protein n=1 Tax=Cytobacillus purgationiresistens TaxID=863449 RepID=A0ABU0AKB0_9BACI|nr:hypothetical protein [Cytobacillus purgationiresistens]